LAIKIELKKKKKLNQVSFDLMMMTQHIFRGKEINLLPPPKGEIALCNFDFMAVFAPLHSA
jgi:hypothetical protein